MGGKKKVGAILGESYLFYQKYFKVFFVTVLLFYGLTYALGQPIGLVLQAVQMDSASIQHWRSYNVYIYVLFFSASSSLSTLLSIPGKTIGVNTYDIMLTLYDGKKPRFSTIAKNFARRWLRYLAVSAWVALFTALWGLLFFIPGIVKSFSYLFAPYLILEYPEMTVRQALKSSMLITEGYKKRLFGLYICMALPLFIADIVLIIPSLVSRGNATVFNFIYIIIGLAYHLFIFEPIYGMATTIAYKDIKQAAIFKGLLVPNYNKSQESSYMNG